MDLDKLEIALRPRSHWEAIDLGFSLARRWFVPLCSLWLMTALPVSLLLIVLFNDNIILMSLLVWWLKPLYEPTLIFWLSRSVFGERPELRSVGRQWWRIVRPQLFANLTWRRLSGNRSFLMPVALLEGLKGKPRHQRANVLSRRQHAGTWLTIVGFHFESILEISFLLLVYFLIPEELRWFDGSDFFFSPGPIDEWIQLFCWLTAMAIIAPFYVAGGFALYLHRRSELEGWDIEINFRRTVENVSNGKRNHNGGVAAAVALVFCLVCSAPQHASAAEPTSPEQSKQSIEQVLADPHFGHMEENTYWRYIGKEKSTEPPSGFKEFIDFILSILEGFMKGIAGYGEFILWGLVIFVVVFLLYHFSKNGEWMRVLPQGGNGKKRDLPTELFGLDVTPDSLPDDIAAEALALVANGQLRSALSLLYRGTLVRLVTDYQLEIPQSATEGECLKLVQRHRQENEADFFRTLTHTWLTTAYAHITPEARHITQLCQDWKEVYGHVGK